MLFRSGAAIAKSGEVDENVPSTADQVSVDAGDSATSAAVAAASAPGSGVIVNGDKHAVGSAASAGAATSGAALSAGADGPSAGALGEDEPHATSAVSAIQ